MQVQVDRATFDGDRLLLFQGDLLVDVGRWVAGRIEGLSVGIAPDALTALERSLRAEEDAAILALHANAYNADGIDRTLIDWLLSLPPCERLDVLESYTGIPYRKILAVLAAHGAEIVVVGGVAAHFYGASYMTKDIDVVYARTPENIRRMLAALAEMSTIFRDFAGRRIVPNESHLATATPKLLLTKHGPLDLLGTLSMEEDDTGHEAISGDAMVVDLDGITVRVLSLPRLIAVKERLRRASDMAVLPLLRAALERASSR
jgi:hypothetical protein